MNFTSEALMGVLLNWLPMILLIAVWLYFVKGMKSGTGIYSNQKRTADALERIAAALEKRSF